MTTPSSPLAPAPDTSRPERLKLFVSTPFRSFGTPEQFCDSLFGVGDAAKDAYVRALVAEIASASAGMEDMLVDEVKFGNGPASSLTSEQLSAVMRTIRANFRLPPDACIHAGEVPGGLTADFAGLCKNVGMSYVEMEMLSADAQALRSRGLPPSAQGVVACFQVAYFAGAPRLGVLLDASFDADARGFRTSVTQALGRDPLFVRVVNLPEGGAGAQAAGVPDEDAPAEVLRRLCERHGLVRAGAGLYAKPGFAGLPAPHASQLGFGVNAVSRFDGVRFKTTGNLALYTTRSCDFAAIARQVS